MRKLFFPLVASAALLTSPAAFAAQTSANFQARVTIQTSCIVTAGILDFGNVGVIVGTETASSNVSVNCSAGTPYTLSFNSVSSVTAYNSTMVNGLEDVAYSAALSGSGGSGPGVFTISGALPVQVTPTAAIYTDNRTVYVNY